MNMKILFTFAALLSIFTAGTLKAQNKAQPDNGKFINIAKTDKTTGRTHLIHYTLTNIGTVPVDFTLYKESSDGTWLTSHGIALSPGATYDDEGNAIGMTGRYVVYSAAHNDMASFPSSREVVVSQGTASSPASSYPTSTPAAPPVTPAVAPSPSPAGSQPVPQPPSSTPAVPPRP